MRFPIFFLFLCVSYAAWSQNPNQPTDVIGQDGSNKVITTAVPFLMITPDSRAAGNGDVGVATAPDVNSSYWNAAKMVFTEDGYGGAGSYSPWLSKIINDMSLFYLTGFYKFRHDQAVSVSMKYFNLGQIQFRNNSNVSQGDFYPREYTFDVNYSRKLSEHLSAGLSVRFIRSNLIGWGGGGTDSKPANTIAADLGVYYTKPLETRNATLSLGANLSNMGDKITYSDAESKDFIPANFRFGAAYKMMLDPDNSLTVATDFNKLLVPSPYQGSKGKTVLGGMFSSFTDAPGGFKEEMQEITASLGVEYWYRQIFSGRLGYFYEAKDKGNRKYLTAGLGFRFLEHWGVDVAYLVPTNKRDNALAETLRITVMSTFIDKKTKKDTSL